MALRIGGSQLPSYPVQRLAQCQQIGGAKAGSARCRQAELISRVYVGESACDRAKPPIFTRVDQPVLAPMTAPADQLKGAAVQRMKRMRDPHLAADRVNTPCS